MLTVQPAIRALAQPRPEGVYVYYATLAIAAGELGLLQPLADGLKFLMKEDIIPSHADKVLYLAAPAIAVSTVQRSSKVLFPCV